MSHPPPGAPPQLRQPAEWQPHAACWLAWPWDEELWGPALAAAQREHAALCRAIAMPTGERTAEPLEILVPDAEREARARSALAGVAARFHTLPYGDIWLRDTAPIFLLGPDRELAAARFRFNGWGGKYLLDGDPEVAAGIVARVGCPSVVHDFVLEGGAIETDGEGTLLTTRQCLLNPNRDPAGSESVVEERLGHAFGIEKVLWLDRGLVNDHTDGHVDTLARFVAPGRVVCMRPSSPSDPNRETLLRIEADLRGFEDARGRRLEVVTVPSPGEVLDDQGTLMPASYVNFYIANRSVVVPCYGCPTDAAAVAAIAQLFPQRLTVGSPARAILLGGGAFHCVTQQQPEARR